MYEGEGGWGAQGPGDEIQLPTESKLIDKVSVTTGACTAHTHTETHIHNENHDTKDLRLYTFINPKNQHQNVFQGLFNF